MEKITIAVTDGRTVITSAGDVFPMMQASGSYSGALLCEACMRRGIRQLWFARTAPMLTLDDTLGWDFREAVETSKAPSGWIHSFKRGTNAEVDLVRPELDRNSPFHDATGVTDLLLALVTFRQLVGVAFHHSASATSRSLLLSKNIGHRGNGLKACPMPQPALDIRTEEPLEWCMPPEQVRELSPFCYIHAYDKNAAYLGAASDLTVGAGQFEHVAGIFDDSTCALPGYFLIADHETMYPKSLPALPPSRKRDGTRWVTTPTLAYLKELMGGWPHILDAYVWTDHHQPLQSWYRTLRDAKRGLSLPSAELTEPARLMALSAVKGCYTSFLAGYLCSDTWDRTGDPLYRPDIRHMIIAKARCTLLRTIRRAQEDGAFVLGCSGIDTFYILSTQSDPVLAKPMRLNLGTEQAFYKVKGTWNLTSDLRGMLEQEGPNNVSTMKLFLEGPAHARTN